MADSLPNIYDASEHYHRKLMFQNWYDHSLATVLAKNEAELAHVHSIKVDDILLDIAGCQKPRNSAIYTRQRLSRKGPQTVCLRPFVCAPRWNVFDKI